MTFLFFFSLSSLYLWLTSLSFSHFLSHLTFTNQFSHKADQPLQSNTAVIPTDHENDGPWFRSASLISNHMKTTGFLGGPWFGDPRPWLSERWWFRWVHSIWSLMVAGCGWFWVCVGSVARPKRRWLAGCGWFCWRMGVGVARWILLKGGWLGVGVA